jgi:hypothetical protein
MPTLLFLLSLSLQATDTVPNPIHISFTDTNARRAKSTLPPSPSSCFVITYLVAPPSASRRAACKPRLADIVVSLWWFVRVLVEGLLVGYMDE